MAAAGGGKQEFLVAVAAGDRALHAAQDGPARRLHPFGDFGERGRARLDPSPRPSAEGSACFRLMRINMPVTLIYGTDKTPEFQRQSRDFAAALRAAGKPVELIVAPNHNHYELPETPTNPYGWAGRAALAMMRLRAA